MKNKKIEIQDWGKISFQEAWDKQTSIFQEVIDQKINNRRTDGPPIPTNNFLIFCEHFPVYTLGKSGDLKNLKINENELLEKGIDFHKINRGGDITFHGPGQLVVYPILDLDNYFTDIHLYLRKLEEIIIQLLSHYDIKAHRLEKATGVWLDPQNNSARKICAMGIRCSRWVTMHGLALNVNTDLNYFEHIIPCGIEDKAVTSIQSELSRTVSIEDVKEKFTDLFLKEFLATLRN